MRGTGFVHGGGNVGGSTEEVTAQREDIRPLGERPVRTVDQELRETMQHWRLNDGFFNGPQAGLYAMGLAAGDAGH